MKDIYDLFIKSVKNRDYESICWILNYIDPEALYKLISKTNPISPDNDGDTIISIQHEQKSATLSLSMNHGLVTIGVRFFNDEEIDYGAILAPLRFKFPLILISLQRETNTFSIRRFSRLSECAHDKSPSQISDM